MFLFIVTSLKKVSCLCFCNHCCTFKLSFVTVLSVFVYSHRWVQRLFGVQPRWQAFILQRKGAHRQQSILQQSTERLRQQVSELFLCSQQKHNKGWHSQNIERLCLCCCRVCVRSRCWDACMVIDGGTSFEFNDGAIATISMSEEDQLRTVLLEHWDESTSLNTWLLSHRGVYGDVVKQMTAFKTTVKNVYT